MVEVALFLWFLIREKQLCCYSQDSDNESGEDEEMKYPTENKPKKI